MDQLESNTNPAKWLTLFGIVLVVVLGFFAVSVFNPSADVVLKRGRKHFDRGNYIAAKKYLKQVIARTKQSSGFRVEAEIFYATCYVRQNRLKQARGLFKKFVATYPNSFWTPQAYFDLAHCELNLKNRAAAERIYKKIIKDFPTRTWAKYSRDRLKELKQQKNN